MQVPLDHSQSSSSSSSSSLQATIDLPISSGIKKIYPKRMGGLFRRLKWYSAVLWLAFFLGPYLRFSGKQAVLFDIPNRQFHFFSLSYFPQDVWILVFVLLFFAMLLVAVTLFSGRIFCGFFCFQTVWSDVFNWIEEQIEGTYLKRKQNDTEAKTIAWYKNKILKHSLWLGISVLTGISFAAWFTDAYQLWMGLFLFNAHVSAWVVIGILTLTTYFFAGFMRDQTCLWLCPYSRIQGAMCEPDTLMPSYDVERGEPRGQLKKAIDLKRAETATKSSGDCIDCHLCVAVCPTGVDIRQGQQLGCISCGLCIDACDYVMEKIEKPKGLVRFSSLNQMQGKAIKPWYMQLPLIIASFIMVCSIAVIIIGSLLLSPMSLNIVHQRQPTFVQLSSGDIRNRYHLKIQNKTHQAKHYQLSVIGLGTVYRLSKSRFDLGPTKALQQAIYLDVENYRINQTTTKIQFLLTDSQGNNVNTSSVFMAR